MADFEWSAAKARANLRKHGIHFEDAALVWSDPLHLLRFDRFEDGEERWHVIGMAGDTLMLLVVHTYPHQDDGCIRIIGARRATRTERKAYEDGDF